ncbi:MAG: serine/threonine protein kinase [Thelocarpon superellum]|nr:MAG: serine/threonine protein kinase [Thelocarpon superellum]
MNTPHDEPKGILHRPKPESSDLPPLAPVGAGAAPVIEPSEPSEPHPADAPHEPPLQTVRFSSVKQEISPPDAQPVDSLNSEVTRQTTDLDPQVEDEIRNLSITLTNTRLQEGRMKNFSFEPVSLPASRVPSNDAQASPALGGASPRPSPLGSTVHSPPLTPAETLSADHPAPSAVGGKAHPDPVTMTPEISPPQGHAPSTSIGKALGSDNDQAPSTSSSRPSTAEMASTQPTSVTDSSVDSSQSKHNPLFTIGPGGDTSQLSLEESATGAGGSGSGTSTPYSQPFAPFGDKDDPYARNKRPPQPKTLEGIDARFKFSGKDSRRHSGHGAHGGQSAPAPAVSRSGSGERHPHIFPHARGGKGHLDEGASHGSMSDLKRFFRLGHKSKRQHSPASKSSLGTSNSTSGTRSPPHQLPKTAVPFADDHGLTSKYGKFGKVLGAGAGGSVRLLKRSGDGVTFAVKEFRDRHPHESERDYAKKVTAEFCIGSTLHHGNIIETLDIVHEHGKWYEVMEYAPFDLFAAVMTGKMSREEVSCSFLQIITGVAYLHSMGLAHRDLKLDNVVVNDHGIMKIIDFGSATVFRYPFENDIVMAHGIVGSDPYLAPEVFDSNKYDPQPPDIWSLAIIFCCMSLRRFPWKAPRYTDNSYKLFASIPTPGTPYSEGSFGRRGDHRPKSTADLPDAVLRSEDDPTSAESSYPASRDSTRDTTSTHRHRHRHRHQGDREASESDPPSHAADDGSKNASSDQLPTPASSTAAPTVANTPPTQIKGPWRLLRLLPRESRSIIALMLEINPTKRATLQEVLADPWLASTPLCRQEDGGEIVSAPGHVHTLEPSANNAPANATK